MSSFEALASYSLSKGCMHTAAAVGARKLKQAKIACLIRARTLSRHLPCCSDTLPLCQERLRQKALKRRNVCRHFK